jgi:hypothetical protein
VLLPPRFFALSGAKRWFALLAQLIRPVSMPVEKDLA